MMSSEESSPHRSVDLLVGDEIEEFVDNPTRRSAVLDLLLSNELNTVSKEVQVGEHLRTSNHNTLDDKEFELPPVETPPTLESILNEVDDEEEEGFGGHEFGPFLGDGSDSASLDTASLASTDSGERSHSRSRRVERSSSSHGFVLRHATLKGISAQLVSAAEKADAGNPTAMAVSEVIAIGTAHGLVLVFDPQQILKMSLGSLSTGVQYGSVSALSINNNCSRLIVGHAHGQITMWDLLNGKLLRTIIDAHPPGNAILHIKFTDDPTIAVCNDSGGSVFELNFRRVLGVRTCESRCIFSGAKGEACCIEPVRSPSYSSSRATSPCLLLALASLTKVLVVTLKPVLRVLLSVSYGKTSPASVPLLAWQMVCARGRVQPMLAFCRGHVVHFFLADCSSPDEIGFSKLRELSLPYDLIGLQWVTSRVLAVLDCHERLHVIERVLSRDGGTDGVMCVEDLQTLDLERVALVYNSSHFKSLATGGNVSQALALVGERACYQSICNYSIQIFLLGLKAVHILSLTTWKERIDLLVHREHWQCALELAWTFYQGTARAVYGLSGNSEKRKAMVADCMIDLLLQYVADTVKKNEHLKAQPAEKACQEVMTMAVDYLILLGRQDVLFGTVWELVSGNSGARASLLSALGTAVLAGRMRTLPPPAARELLSMLRQRGMLANLEACLLQMDVTALDLQQVLDICWTHGLYDAIFNVNNTGMNDYISPMQDILKMLQNSFVPGQQQLPEDKVLAGNKLLVYISCCLVGRAYPVGDIPANLVATVKKQVFECLVSLHSDNTTADEDMYPHVRTLLRFDTREFLNVLALTFVDVTDDRQALEFQQRIVDVLLKVMVEGGGFSPSQVGSLFTFLARQLARPDNTLFVNRQLFEQVLEFLCTSGDNSRHAERQQALLELLQAGGTSHFEEEYLLGLAEKAQFYHVCEFILERKEQYGSIVLCYLRDHARQEAVFPYIHNLLSLPGYTPAQCAAVRQQALSHMKDLAEINARKTADLVVDHFGAEILQVLDSLQSSPQLLLHFLESLLEPLGSGQGVRNIGEGPVVAKTYLELLSGEKPTAVLPFLKSCDMYYLEEAIQIVECHSVLDAVSYLLEKKGDAKGAFTVILKVLKKDLQSYVNAQGSVEDSSGQSLSNVESTLMDVVGLCQRNSGKLEERERQGLWFPLLEVMLAQQRKLGPKFSAQVEELKGLTREVINSMAGFIAIPSILLRLLQDPAYSASKFGEVKDLMLTMLDTFNYEKTLLSTTTDLIRHDLHWALSQLRGAAARGLHPRGEACGLCGQAFRQRHGPTGDRKLLVFGCGHGYHADCLTGAMRAGSYPPGTHLTSILSMNCYLCHASQAGSKQKSDTHLSQHSKLDIGTKDKRQEKQRKKVAEITMDHQQVQALEALHNVSSGPSRIAVLAELARSREQDSTPARGAHGTSDPTSVLFNKSFQLRLVPPPLRD